MLPSTKPSLCSGEIDHERSPEKKKQKTLRAWTASDYPIGWIYRVHQTEMSDRWYERGSHSPAGWQSR
jgi:hypothetical protein